MDFAGGDFEAFLCVQDVVMPADGQGEFAG